MRSFLLSVLVLGFVFGMNVCGFGQDFEWAKKYGGSGLGSNDVGYSIVNDSTGNFYVTGQKNSNDIFIAKYSMNGYQIWSRTIDGGNGYNTKGSSIELDNKGYIYIAGVFENTISFDTVSLVSNGSVDVFLAKYNINGDFQWCTSFGSTGWDIANQLSIDNNNILLNADFQDSLFINNTYNFVAQGVNNQLILKYNPGGSLLWAKNTKYKIYDIEKDKNGNYFYIGSFSDTIDFDPSNLIFNLSPNGAKSSFIMKLDSNENFLWVKKYGFNSASIELTIDKNNNLYIYGVADDSSDFDPDPNIEDLYVLDNDPFLLKLDSNGLFNWVNIFSNINNFSASQMEIDLIKDELLIVFNYGDTIDIDPSSAIQLVYPIEAGYPSVTYLGWDGCLAKYSLDGDFLWHKNIGGESNDYIYSSSFDLYGNIYSTGTFHLYTNFDPGYTDIILHSSSWADMFVMKLGQCIKTESTINTINCSSYTVPSGNQTFSNPGYYLIQDTIINYCGEDSLITINLTLDTNTTYSTSIENCISYNWSNGITYYSDTVVIDTFLNFCGLDSILILDLKILNSSSYLDTQSSPSPFTWIDGNTYTTDNNTATETLVNAAGCDSVVTLNLTIIDTIIQGNITTSLGNALQNSKVYLIKYYAAQDSVFAMDSTFTDAVGFYEFTSTFQNAYVKAVPNITNYPNEIPTYNVSSAVFQNADAVYLSYPFGNTDFSTIAGVNAGGNGFIAGIVGNGAGKNSEVGELLPNISLVLMNASNDVVAQTYTDANGYFEFTNLAEESFSIWVDKAGILNNLAPEISLATDNNKDDLKFVLHKTYLENITSVGIENITLNNFS
ncbi:MAG: hypothetical protein ACPG4Y_10470, partial [Chitinophagales bacterium]